MAARYGDKATNGDQLRNQSLLSEILRLCNRSLPIGVAVWFDRRAAHFDYHRKTKGHRVLGSSTNRCEPGLGNQGMRSALTVPCKNRRSEMADHELIAAILTAGMLPTLEIPRSRLQGRSSRVTAAEGQAIRCAVDHAFGVYRLVLNELGADPFASRAEPGAQPRAAAVGNGATGRPKHERVSYEHADC